MLPPNPAPVERYRGAQGHQKGQILLPLNTDLP